MRILRVRGCTVNGAYGLGDLTPKLVSHFPVDGQRAHTPVHKHYPGAVHVQLVRPRRLESRPKDRTDGMASRKAGVESVVAPGMDRFESPVHDLVRRRAFETQSGDELSTVRDPAQRFGQEVSKQCRNSNSLGTVEVFYDSQSTLTGKTFADPGASPDFVYFGEGSVFGTGTSDWAYVTHNAFTCAS